MRTCQSCALENRDHRDFCECGEYLRWEPTGFVPAVTSNPAGQPPAPSAPPRTAVQPAVQQPRASAHPPEATITLRDAEHGVTLAVGVEPGQRERALALVRNQSGIVDNYELRVDGIPREWWSVFPDTVYLVPVWLLRDL